MSITAEDIITIIKNGDVKQMEVYLKKYTNNTKVYSLENPQSTILALDKIALLRQAIYTKNYNMSKLLIDYGVRPSGKVFMSPPDLHIAASQGNYKIFKLILKHTPNPLVGEYSTDNIPIKMQVAPSTCTHPTHNENVGKVFTIVDEYNYPLLNYAVQGGNMRIIQKILKKTNVNINTMDPIGKSALHYACMYGKLDIVKYLITQGAMIDNKLDVCKDIPSGGEEYGINYVYGCTPLHCAVLNNRKEIVAYLLEQGADITKESTKFKYRGTKDDKEMQSKSIVSSTRNIHIKYLLTKYAIEKEIRNNAHIKYYLLNDLEMLTYENNLDAIKEINLEQNSYKSGELAIFAIKLGRFEIFKYFIENKLIDIHYKAGENDYDYSFLKFACEYTRNQNYDLCEYILSHGFNPKYGASALHYVTNKIFDPCGFGFAEKANEIYDASDVTSHVPRKGKKLIKLLMSYNIKFSPTSYNFILICQYGDYLFVKYMIEYFKKEGNLPEAINRLSLNIFEYISDKSSLKKGTAREDIARLLLDNGMDVNKVNSYSKLCFIDNLVSKSGYFNSVQMRILLVALLRKDIVFDMKKMTTFVNSYKDEQLYTRKNPSSLVDKSSYNNYNTCATYIPILKSMLMAFKVCDKCNINYVNACYGSSCCKCDEVIKNDIAGVNA